jgi:hypothetical protein
VQITPLAASARGAGKGLGGAVASSLLHSGAAGRGGALTEGSPATLILVTPGGEGQSGMLAASVLVNTAPATSIFTVGSLQTELGRWSEATLYAKEQPRLSTPLYPKSTGTTSIE